ncbi:MAG: tyrosine-type recombinase/integrase [Corynebacterium sp.]|nr:tyrosine-type recombinase/integrase [Corynebacterium sp.]
MASIQAYEIKAGKRWRVQYRSPDGVSRTKQGFRSRREAQRWAAANTTTIDQGLWCDPRAARKTVAEIGDRWLAGRAHIKPSTRRVEEIQWRKHVRPWWGRRAIGDIRPSDVQAWVAALDSSPSSIRHYHCMLAQILDSAVKDRFIAINPARGVKLPRRVGTRKVFLTPAQLRLVVESSRKYQSLIWLLGTTGLRWGEATGLKVGDVDFSAGRISVQRNAVLVGSKIVIGSPKTHEFRVVAVPAPVLDLLAVECAGRHPEEWLWPGRDGLPVRLPGKSGFFGAAVRRAQQVDSGIQTLSIHGLRHVAAGLMVSAGANVKVVQRQLGHASAAMTLDIYAELFDGDLDSVARVMGDLLESSC